MNGKWGMNDPEIKPAVAALVMGDKASFYYCNFYGVQDTLWDQQGRHFYQNCRIEGLCDFIWGNAQSYYENCDLVSQGAGFITAQGRDAEDETTGFVFYGGTVTGIGPTYLGRAYRSHSRVIFHNTTFDHIIHPLGWDAWYYKHHEANFTYAEIECNAGLNETGKGMEKTIDDRDIPKFTTYSFINDPEKWMNNQPHPNTIHVTKGINSGMGTFLLNPHKFNSCFWGLFFLGCFFIWVSVCLSSLLGQWFCFFILLIYLLSLPSKKRKRKIHVTIYYTIYKRLQLMHPYYHHVLPNCPPPGRKINFHLVISVVRDYGRLIICCVLFKTVFGL
ncbi:hypothetical protein MKW92_012891 [Papaver armeniacum]|nr:hypothetical protein MKW92_012891 [Papaver armeniacum]